MVNENERVRQQEKKEIVFIIFCNFLATHIAYAYELLLLLCILMMVNLDTREKKPTRTHSPNKKKRKEN